MSLSSVTPVVDPDTGYATYVVPALVTAPNAATEAEAVALVDTGTGGGVINFYDIGGGASNILATEGPAAGETSENIPGSPLNTSIQFDVFGNRVDGPLTTNSSVVCFGNGMMIATSKGSVPVEDLPSAIGSGRWTRA
ncbi:hypothetical protein [Jannaschia marina]|uniref:hypothetical protein n=1 Tax=Jannaschia marina TaxID=2741674 RepID=UPI0015CB969A|nr:hypothetical protein [Jannaschia marina]